MGTNRHNKVYHNHVRGILQWYQVHSHCSATVPTVYLQDVFISSDRNSAPIEQFLCPLPPPLVATTPSPVSVRLTTRGPSCDGNDTVC